MLTQVVERHEMRRACGAVHENDPADLGLQVLIEGLFLDDPAEAQRCLASFAYQHLSDGPYAGRLGRRLDGDWTVELEGEDGRWLVMRPVTRDCADIDQVYWDVLLHDTNAPFGATDGSDAVPATDALVSEHLGLDPTLVDDLVEIALSTPVVEREFRPLVDESAAK
ncbi:MAG: hypothetical protein Q4G51_05690 [Dermatophilus congolensis]|nr:hypothetical protein [Dermatophilus congolensis]